MHRVVRLPVLVLTALALVLLSVPAVADHASRPSTENLIARGHSPNPASFFNPDIAPPEINSDLAFWGDLAFNGNYDGFRIIDIFDPARPEEIVHQRCEGNQGDIVVWEDGGDPRDTECDGAAPPHLRHQRRGGLMSRAAHTATDEENGRVIIYNQSSGGLCLFMDVIEVPLDNPARSSFAALLRQVPMEHHEDDAEDALRPRGCHDSSVILGDVNMVVCASGHSANVFDIGDNEWAGGSVDDPEFLYTIEEQGVGVGGSWHSATFTWDGEVIVLGWERWWRRGRVRGH